MAIYEYEYITAHGEVRRVEEWHNMKSAPKTTVVVHDSVPYTAKRVMSLTARMAGQWDSYEPSDLPPTS